MKSDSSCKTFLDTLPHDRVENQFKESKPLFSAEEASLEASRCLYCFDAPCITACPTAINIPQFIQRISTRNLRGAARSILSANPMGLSCALACPTEVLCEGACVHQDLTHKPIQIGRLQRFAVESLYKEKIQLFKSGAATGKRVALIGAGPAALSCARDLRLLGHETVVFEKSDLPGGLNTAGIAPYKMKANVSLLEIENLVSLGVQFEFEKELGRNLWLTTLLNDFDALFVGIGLGDERSLECEGMDSPKVMGAVDFISQLKIKSQNNMPKLKNLNSVLVVGGGNTALDAVRELKQLNVPQVALSYRKNEEEMSGYKHEMQAARLEGVQFYFQTVLTRIDHQVTLKQLNKSPESFFHLKVDQVLLAVGHLLQENLFSQIPEIVFKNGKIQAHAQTGQTGHPYIFVGGDLLNGGKEVVHAVQTGKNAARSIHEVIHHG